MTRTTRTAENPQVVDTIPVRGLPSSLGGGTCDLEGTQASATAPPPQTPVGTGTGHPTATQAAPPPRPTGRHPSILTPDQLNPDGDLHTEPVTLPIDTLPSALHAHL